MSTDQSDLDEFDRSSPRHPKNSGRGKPKTELTDRPACGAEGFDGRPCESPVVPGQPSCWRHLGGPGSVKWQDVGPLVSAVKSDGSEVEEPDAVHCPNGHPIPAMYRPMCPECGHRRED